MVDAKTRMHGSYRSCVQDPGDTGSRVSAGSHEASEGPDRTAPPHCTDNPESGGRLLHKHKGH